MIINYFNRFRPFDFQPRKKGTKKFFFGNRVYDLRTTFWSFTNSNSSFGSIRKFVKNFNFPEPLGVLYMAVLTNNWLGLLILGSFSAIARVGVDQFSPLFLEP